MNPVQTVSPAVQALEALAAGRAPDPGHCLRGARTLEVLAHTKSLANIERRELLDAAGLLMLADGGVLELDAAERARAAQLARRILAAWLVGMPHRGRPHSR